MKKEENKVVTLTNLSVDDINTILVALSKLPLEAVLGVWGKVKTQAEEQLKEEKDGKSN